MVKITLGGVTTEVPESELDWYKRNGWKIAEEAPTEPEASVEAGAETELEAPAKKRSTKKE